MVAAGSNSNRPGGRPTRSAAAGPAAASFTSAAAAVATAPGPVAASTVVAAKGAKAVAAHTPSLPPSPRCCSSDKAQAPDQGRDSAASEEPQANPRDDRVGWEGLSPPLVAEWINAMGVDSTPALFVHIPTADVAPFDSVLVLAIAWLGAGILVDDVAGP